MKKEYIKPIIEVVQISYEHDIANTLMGNSDVTPIGDSEEEEYELEDGMY